MSADEDDSGLRSCVDRQSLEIHGKGIVVNHQLKLSEMWEVVSVIESPDW